MALRACSDLGFIDFASARGNSRYVGSLGGRVCLRFLDALLLCLSVAGDRCVLNNKPRQTETVAANGIHSRNGSADTSLVRQFAQKPRCMASYAGLVKLASPRVQSVGSDSRFDDSVFRRTR